MSNNKNVNYNIHADGESNNDEIGHKNLSSNGPFGKVGDEKEHIIKIEECTGDQMMEMIYGKDMATELKSAGLVFGDLHYGCGITHAHPGNDRVHENTPRGEPWFETQIGNAEFVGGGVPFVDNTTQYYTEFKNNEYTFHHVPPTQLPASFSESYEKPSDKLTVVHMGIPECHCSAFNRADERAVQENDIYRSFVLFLTGTIFAFSIVWLFFCQCLEK